jgi:hypothetical protein
VELKDYLAANLDDAHRMANIALDALTDEVAHYRGSDTVNSIAQILAHMTMGEDGLIHRTIQGGQRLFETQGWESKTGIPSGQGLVWQDKLWRLNLPAFAEYQAAVQEAASACVRSLSQADLEREVVFGPFTRPVADQLRGIVIHHLLGHSGEISALKGVQGLKGLPF